MKSPWMIAAIALLVVFAGASPTLADGGGSIYACVNQSSGDVKIVAAGTTCHNNWTLVEWNANRTSPARFTIDCDEGQSIQDALAFDFVPGDTLLVKGTCNENVNIQSSKVHQDVKSITIDGQGSATIHGVDTTAPTVAIRTRGITLQNFTITGGSDGIGVIGGATATIAHNTITGAVSDGIYVTMGAVATIDGNTIQGAGRFGINLDQGGVGRIVGNTVQGSRSHGILVDESSSGRIGFLTFHDTTARPNTVQDNGGSGVAVTRASSAIILANTITGNSGSGVHLSRGAHADVGANELGGNTFHGVAVLENSVLSIGETGLGFDGANSTATANTRWGILCADGGVLKGRLGSLIGARGTVGFGTNPPPAPPDTTCINRTTP